MGLLASSLRAKGSGVSGCLGTPSGSAGSSSTLRGSTSCFCMTAFQSAHAPAMGLLDRLSTGFRP